MVLPTKELPFLSSSSSREDGERREGARDATFDRKNINGRNKPDKFSPETGPSQQQRHATIHAHHTRRQCQIAEENNDANSGGLGTSNKILNFLNTKNNLISSSTSSPPKIAEDELFFDLKSRFIEKHFRTILRSQQKSSCPPENNSVNFNNTNNCSGTGANYNYNCNSNNNFTTLLKSEIRDGPPPPGKNNNGTIKPLKIITVERPEPQLDLPRVSYFKSTQLKLFKMHEQFKSRAADRCRKFMASLKTTVWPALYPIQVFLEAILCNLIVLLAAPFAALVAILLFFVRCVISIVLKIRYKGRFQLMAGSDAAWAYQSYANDSSFLGLYVIQGDCSISRIRERIMKSVINCQDPQYPGKFTYSRLKCRITEKFGFYCWETVHPLDFCIDDHVRYITNDPSAVLSQEQVIREIQKFIDTPLPADSPPWQILVVPKFLYSREQDYCCSEDILEDDGFGNFDTITVKKPSKNGYFYRGNHYYALVWRINHALMDGISAANCLQHCVADMPVKLTIDPLAPLQVPIGLKILAYLNMFFFGSRSFFKAMFLKDLNCFHGPQLTGPKNLGWSRLINLEAVKQIRRRNDATTTSVLATTAGGSLRGLALRKNNPVPKEIRCGVTCALLPYPNIKPQNRFTVAHLNLNLEADSLKERLQSANKSARELVRSGDILKNYGLIRLVGLAPKKIIPLLMNNCEATLVISNIPGPMEEYTIFQGQKLVDVIGWNTIKGNTAIGICYFSYAGRIRAGVVGDGAVLPSSTDVPGIIEELEKDLLNLAKEADLKEKDVFRDAL